MQLKDPAYVVTKEDMMNRWPMIMALQQLTIMMLVRSMV